MYIPIITVVQNGHNSGGLGKGHILLKNVLWQINFQVEGQLYVICCLHIITFQYKSFHFWFLNRGICMDIPILTGAQKGQISS